MAGIYNNRAAGIWQKNAVPGYDSTVLVPENFGLPFMEAAMPNSNQYHEPSPRLDFSSNGYSGIGSQFQLDINSDSEGNPLMDPIFSQGLSTNFSCTTGSTADSQIRSSAYAESLYCDVLIPTTLPSQAVMPAKVTPWLAPTFHDSSTDPSASLTTLPNTASLGTCHSDRSSKFSHPYHKCGPKAAGTYDSLHCCIASLGYTAHGNSSTSIMETEERGKLVSTEHRLNQDTFPRLAFEKPSEPNQPKAIGHSGYDKPPKVTVSATASASPPSSLTKPKVEHDVLHCPWKGCYATRKGKHRKLNMRNHVRDSRGARTTDM